MFSSVSILLFEMSNRQSSLQSAETRRRPASEMQGSDEAKISLEVTMVARHMLALRPSEQIGCEVLQ